MSPRARATADVALLVLLLTVTALTALTGPSDVRTVVAVAAVCLIPGGAALTLLPPVGGVGQWLGMATALSMAIVAAGAFTMLWAPWQPGVLGGALAASSGALLSFDAVRRAREAQARPAAGRHRADVADRPIGSVNGGGDHDGPPPVRRLRPDAAARRRARAMARHRDGAELGGRRRRRLHGAVSLMAARRAGGALGVYSATLLSLDAVKRTKEAETW
jgi:hypothetical protein